MGGGRWDSSSFASSRATYNTSKPTTAHIYTKRSIDHELDPNLIKLRESRDSAANPLSTAVIVALDVTGSMSPVLDYFARQGVGQLVGQIYERKPVTDPHVLIMGIGDFECDRSPLQATQFEAENKPLIEQLEKLYLEGGGGGNNHESYSAAWWFAATKTSIDCFEKRGKKGFLFTIGDEEPTPTLFARDMKRVLDLDEADLSGEALLQRAQTMYHVFHIIVEEGDYCRRNLDHVHRAWKALLGQGVLPLSDKTRLAELCVSAMEIVAGRDKAEVTASWDGKTGAVVSHGLRDLMPAENRTGGMSLNY